mmetsp:Transcript_23340/g.64760  ORF Transcript_23340/g.64760 Transcript_23340/m.64760 type:complete len:381 (-) Transcript_23340:259-1401(-)
MYMCTYYTMRPSQPPISLVPPFRFADEAATKAYGQLFQGRSRYVTDFCNVESADIEQLYFTLRGARHCAVYELSVEEWEGDGCEALTHDSSIITGNEAVVLEPNHVTLGSCEAGNWKDYYFEVTSQDEDSNIALTVEDMSNADNPDGLEVHMYMLVDQVPVPRIPDVAVTSARKGIYSIGLNELRVHPGNYFVSVRCVSGFSRHRVALELVQAEVKAHQTVGGYVVPGVWTYHFFTVPATATHFRFELTIYTGHVYLAAARQDYPPSFVTLGSNRYTRILSAVGTDPSTYTINICNSGGQKHFLGMFGGDIVADYLARVVVLGEEEKCSTEGLPGYKTLAFVPGGSTATNAAEGGGAGRSAAVLRAALSLVASVAVAMWA